MKDPDRPSIGSFLICLLGLGWGVWALYTRDPGQSRIWPWVAISICGLLVLLNVIMLLVPGSTPRGAAESIARLEQDLYSGAHQYRPADDVDFRGLDLGFYESTTNSLKSAGYRHLGDVVDVTSAQAAKWARAVIRILISPDATVTAGIYHVKLSGFPRLLQVIGLLSRNMRTLSLESEFDDGSFAATTNDREINTTSEFPGVSRVQLPLETTPEVLLEEHRRHVARALGADPDRQPLVFHTVRDVLASQNRLEALKSAHRANPDFDYRSEIAQVMGRPLSEQERKVAAEVDRLRKQ